MALLPFIYTPFPFNAPTSGYRDGVALPCNPIDHGHLFSHLATFTLPSSWDWAGEGRGGDHVGVTKVLKLKERRLLHLIWSMFKQKPNKKVKAILIGK